MKTEIQPLTGLRGIAALWVVAHHSLKLAPDISQIERLPLSLLGKAGYLGVDIFFVLSGFVIAFSYANAELHGSISRYGSFLWKRLARIYPVHIAVLALFALTFAIRTVDADLSISGLIRTLTLTHAWDAPIEKIWHSVSWSISAEWAAYLSFPAIALATRRVTPAVAILSICALFVVLWLAIAYGPWQESFAYGMHRIAAEFTAGVLLYRLWCQRRETVNVATITALIALLIATNFVDLFGGSGTSMAGAPIIACVVVYGLACSTGWLATAFTKLEHLGHISYALYLVHMIPYGIARQILAEHGWTTSAVAVYGAIFASVVVSLIAAHLIYKTVEQPSRAYLLNITASNPFPASR